jgi:hypothetical protein
LLDNSIDLYKKLAEILESFTTGLAVDLDELNQKIANSGHQADSYFEKMSSHVEDWTSKVQSSFESVSMNVEVSSSSMKQGQLLMEGILDCQVINEIGSRYYKRCGP